MESNDSVKVGEYAKPEIVDHGSLTELTAHQVIGHHLDATFSAGTPTSSVTVSGP